MTTVAILRLALGRELTLMVILVAVEAARMLYRVGQVDFMAGTAENAAVLVLKRVPCFCVIEICDPLYLHE